ncbi:hypothetical protein PCE1_003510 [Barthelona sp. PCE]
MSETDKNKDFYGSQPPSTELAQEPGVATRNTDEFATLDPATKPPMPTTVEEAAGLGVLEPQLNELHPVLPADDDQILFAEVPNPPPFMPEDFQPQSTVGVFRPQKSLLSREMTRVELLKKKNIWGVTDEDIESFAKKDGAFIPHLVIPKSTYNIVVLGSGPAAIEAALTARSMGASVLIVDKEWCHNLPELNRIQISSFTRSLVDAQNLARIGMCTKPHVHYNQFRTAFSAFCEKVRIRYSSRLVRIHGIDICLGNAVFETKKSLKVGEHNFEFSRCIIAAQGNPTVPSIANIDQIEYLTEFSPLPEILPGGICIVGSTPAAIEYAQFYSSLGSKVSLFSHDMLRDFEPEAVDIVRSSLERMRIELFLGRESGIVSVEKRGRIITVNHNGGSIKADAIMLCTNRRVDFSDMEVENASLDVNDENKINVDSYMSCKNKRVFVLGTGASTSLMYQRNLSSEFVSHARLAVQNAIHQERHRVKTTARTVFSYPSISQIGPVRAMEESGASAKGYRLYEWHDLTMLPVLCTSSDTSGLLKVVIDKDGFIVSVVCVCQNSEDVLQPIAFCFQNRLKVKALAYSFTSPAATGSLLREFFVEARFYQKLGKPKDIQKCGQPHTEVIDTLPSEENVKEEDNASNE